MDDVMWKKRCGNFLIWLSAWELFIYLIWKNISHRSFYAEFHLSVKYLQENTFFIYFWCCIWRLFTPLTTVWEQGYRSEKFCQIHRAFYSWPEPVIGFKVKMSFITNNSKNQLNWESIYIYNTGCFTTCGPYCRRWFPRSLWSKKFI